MQQERSQRTFYENYSLQLDYNHTFGNVHNVAAMVGANAEKRTYKNVTAKRTDLLYDGLFDLNTGSAGSTNQTVTGGSNAARIYILSDSFELQLCREIYD